MWDVAHVPRDVDENVDGGGRSEERIFWDGEGDVKQLGSGGTRKEALFDDHLIGKCLSEADKDVGEKRVDVFNSLGEWRSKQNSDGQGQMSEFKGNEEETVDEWDIFSCSKRRATISSASSHWKR
jgi:hypothetical protein